MASDESAVSAVIPAYNESARIAGAIASVWGQSEPPLEVLVIDDGSSDDTADIAAGLGARVISQPNRGLAAARNRGLREARGGWVAFLDADDHWYPEKLSWLRRARERRPNVAVAFSDFEVVEDGIARGSQLTTFAQYRGLAKERLAESIVAVARDAFVQALIRGNFLSSSTLAVRRSLVLERDVFYDERLPSVPGYHVSEDIEWYLRILKWSDALVVELVLADYCRHERNLSASAGRLKYGDVKLGEWIARVPERYAPGAAEGFARERRFHLHHAAELYLRALDFSAARAMLGHAQRERFQLGDALLSALATGLDNRPGRRLGAATRRAWKRSLKPALAALRARAQ